MTHSLSCQWTDVERIIYALTNKYAVPIIYAPTNKYAIQIIFTNQQICRTNPLQGLPLSKVGPLGHSPSGLTV